MLPLTFTQTFHCNVNAKAVIWQGANSCFFCYEEYHQQIYIKFFKNLNFSVRLPRLTFFFLLPLAVHSLFLWCYPCSLLHFPRVSTTWVWSCSSPVAFNVPCSIAQKTNRLRTWKYKSFVFRILFHLLHRQTFFSDEFFTVCRPD